MARTAGGTLVFDPSAGPIPPISGPVELRTGPGGTLDVRGFGPGAPVLATDGAITIYADTILIDPGVTLDDIFSPSPEVVAGTDILETRLTPVSYSCDAGGGAHKAKMLTQNLSNNETEVAVSWADTLGWVTPDALVTTLPPGETGIAEFVVNVPHEISECVIDKISIAANAGEPSPSEYALEVASQVDFDLDGVVDRCDGCWAISESDQLDTDADGLGDVCDLCPNTFNPGQLDEDSNGIADACDLTGIPAVSQWGVAILALLVLVAGTGVLRRRGFA